MSTADMAGGGARQNAGTSAVGRRRWAIGLLWRRHPDQLLRSHQVFRSPVRNCGRFISSSRRLDLGLLFSAFFWSYALLQIPAGLVVDRLGVTQGRPLQRLPLERGLRRPSQPVPVDSADLLLARLVLGIAEAPSLSGELEGHRLLVPAVMSIVHLAIFDVGGKFSNVVGVPLVALAVVPLRMALGLRYGGGASELRVFPGLLPHVPRPKPNT